MGIADEPTATVAVTVADDGVPVISLGGELDLASVESVRSGIQQYLTDGPARVTFDLEDLAFMDSSGIALLLQVSNEIERIELRNVRPNVRRVLEVTGLLETFGLT